MTRRPLVPIALLGAGKLGEALLQGLHRAGLTATAHLTATVRAPERAAELSGRYGVPVLTDNRAAVRHARLVLLGVKAEELPALLADVGPILPPDACVVSLAAGVPLRALEAHLPPACGPHAVRALCNAPMAVGAGVTAVAAGPRARPEDVTAVEALFGAVGRVLRVEEAQLDAVNGLAGAGPALVLRLVEALAAGGQAEGLPPEVALQLALGTVEGAARWGTEAGTHPETLVAQVVNPGGATAAALDVLAQRGASEALAQAVRAATSATRARSRALDLPLP